jgi:uncharacterized damage-inducible protein DinB
VNSAALQTEPKLGKPGAGLPFFEWAYAKYILLPRLFKNTTKEKALGFFTDEANKIIAIASSLSLEQFSQRRLIPRLPGLEDSSRYRSVAMTLDHLIIVGSGTRQLIVGLSSGKSGFKARGTADVKPNVNVDATTILSAFKEMIEDFVKEINAVNTEAYPDHTHPHPWFGPHNARNWLAFASVHQRLHRQQIEAIIARL